MTIVRILVGLVNAILKIFVQVLIQGLATLVHILSIAGLTAVIAIAAALAAGALLKHRRHH